MDLLFLAFIALENAQDAVIRKHGISVFQTSVESNWELIHLQKLKHCKVVQAYFKALKACNSLQDVYLEDETA
jgi:hypothetical protein